MWFKYALRQHQFFPEEYPVPEQAWEEWSEAPKEKAPLWHGTTKDSYEEMGGYISPRVGDFVENAYGAEYEDEEGEDYFEDAMTEAVYMATDDEIEKTLTAMWHHINKMKGVPHEKITPEDIAKYGALLAIREPDNTWRLHSNQKVSRFTPKPDFRDYMDSGDSPEDDKRYYMEDLKKWQEDSEPDYGDYPAAVESGDVWSESSQDIDAAITGVDLVKFLYEHADEFEIPESDSRSVGGIGLSKENLLGFLKSQHSKGYDSPGGENVV